MRRDYASQDGERCEVTKPEGYLAEKIAEIRKRCETTPGPWPVSKQPHGSGSLWLLSIPKRINDNGKDCATTLCTEKESEIRFISHSRTDIPLLLEMLELAHDALEDAQEALLVQHSWLAAQYEVQCIPTEDEVMQSYSRQKEAKEALAALEKLAEKGSV